MASSEEKPGFTVTDRRSFTAGGEPRDAPAPAPPPPATEAAGSARQMPPVDFSTFVLSLGSSALMHLGEVEDPRAGKKAKDLPLAKHTIDLLSMLQAKTRGNLTAEEDQLLEHLLYDLRLRFVEASKAP